MMDVLRVENLHKRFGQTTVINGISLSVPEGSVFGFIGQNGAGKTTTMKMVLGLLQSDSGEITVCGERVTFGSTKTNRHIGFLPDVPEFYNYMRPKEYLRLCGEITGMAADRIKSRSGELLEMVGLSKQNKKIGSFSRGMKQRLGVAQALLTEPKLLICDEPTSALDPVGRKEILDILCQIKGRTTVVFSTHILSDVERICDRAALLHNGKIAMEGTLAALRAKRRSNGIMVEFSSMEDKARFTAQPEIGLLMDGAKQTGTEIMLSAGDIAEAEAIILRVLSQSGILPIKLEVAEPTIESLFLEVVQ